MFLHDARSRPLSRLQWAWAIAWHILLQAFSVGLASYIAVLVAIAGVSIRTPLAHPDIARRWFSWPNIALLSPVLIVPP